MVWVAAEDGVAGEQVVAFFRKVRERMATMALIREGLVAKPSCRTRLRGLQRRVEGKVPVRLGLRNAAVDIIIILVCEGGAHLFGVIRRRNGWGRKRGGQDVPGH